MRKFLGTYFFAIALIVVIVIIFDAAENVDKFIESKATFGQIAVDYYMNFIPYFVNQFSGLFTFIAVIFFTSKMAYQTEIVAMLSGGVSFRRFLWPYFLSAAFITLMALILSLAVIPAANERRIDFEMNYTKKNRSQKFERHIYRQITPGTFTYIRDFNGKSNTASYLVIEKFEGSSIVSSLEAGDIKYNPETKHWTAPKYLTRVFDGERELFETHERLDTLINLETEELGRVEDLVKTMNISELGAFIKEQKTKGSDMIAVFEVERHSRFSNAFGTFILTLIGVSLSSRKVRGGTGLHIGVGIALCFSYILFGRFAEEFAKGGVIPPAIAVWIPNIIYAVIAVYLYKKAPK